MRKVNIFGAPWSLKNPIFRILGKGGLQKLEIWEDCPKKRGGGGGAETVCIFKGELGKEERGGFFQEEVDTPMHIMPKGMGKV